MGKMLEKGHQNVKEIWRNVDCSLINLCNPVVEICEIS